MSYTPEPIARKAIGRFLPAWTADLLAVHAGSSNLRLSLFSAHDSTVGPLLAAMQVLPSEYPGYGSRVILEYYRDNNNNGWVVLLFDDVAQPLPACAGQTRDAEGTVCHLEAFMARVHEMAMTQTEFEQACIIQRT